MTYTDFNDSVNQLYASAKNLYEELEVERQKPNFQLDDALNKLKAFAEEIGETTGDFLFNLCSVKDPGSEDELFKQLQEIQTWFKETTIFLLNFKTQEQGILPPFPRKRK